MDYADDNGVSVIVAIFWTWFEGDRSKLDNVVFGAFVSDKYFTTIE